MAIVCAICLLLDVSGFYLANTKKHKYWYLFLCILMSCCFWYNLIQAIILYGN